MVGRVRGASTDRRDPHHANTASVALPYRSGPAVAGRLHRAPARWGDQSRARSRAGGSDVRGGEPRQHVLP